MTRIHGVPCSLLRVGDAYRVTRTDTGAKVAEAPQRFLAVARAAILLNTPTAHPIPRRRNHGV
jgi:hypothetical protein